MRVAFDIGGVLSKFPARCRTMIAAFEMGGIEVHVITDMHDRPAILQQLHDNGFRIPPERVHNSDYNRYGEMCKAVLLHRLGIDVIFDDFPGYCVWDPRWGSAPMRLLVQPDPWRPYWSPDWKLADGSPEFGRRVCPSWEELNEQGGDDGQGTAAAGEAEGP